jgi:hypothetical protein
MASSSKRQTTREKMAREQAVRDRRARKQQKKDDRKQGLLAPAPADDLAPAPADDETLPDAGAGDDGPGGGDSPTG